MRFTEVRRQALECFCSINFIRHGVDKIFCLDDAKHLYRLISYNSSRHTWPINILEQDKPSHLVMSANCLKCDFLTISHQKNLEIFSKSFWVENECPCYQQYCHSYHVTKTDLFKIALKFSFEKCIITRSTEEGGLKVTLSTTQTFIYMLHAISCPAHHWLTSGYLQSCYTHPIRQAGGICLWQTINTATLVRHTCSTHPSGRVVTQQAGGEFALL